jgi:hypothetical protein
MLKSRKQNHVAVPEGLTHTLVLGSIAVLALLIATGVL